MKIIIVGGGFAGVRLALSLAHNIKFQVTLVDKNAYNFFPPFLYQVTTSFFEPFQISNTFLDLFSGKENLDFYKGELQRIVPTENQIVLDNGILSYDYLVLATGTEPNFFGAKNIAEKAMALKTIDDALALRNRLVRQIQKTETVKNKEELRKAMTFVVAGGGPTGVEMAALLAGIKTAAKLNRDPGLSGIICAIYLVQKEAVLLPALSEKPRQQSVKYLEKLGVNILLNTYVQEFFNGEVTLSNGEVIQTENLIWAAGIKGRKFLGLAEEVYGKGDRIRVDGYQKVLGTYNIFAIGDICLETSSVQYPDGHPQLAQVAIQQGEYLARNFQLMAEQKKLKKFIYQDPGTSVVTGRMNAVTVWNRFNIHLTGKPAWLAHIFFNWYPMTGHGSRIKLVFYSVRSYLTKRHCF